MGEKRMRATEGRWIGPCSSGSPSTDPIVIEREKRYLEEFMASITPEMFKEVIMVALKEARDGEGRAQEKAKAWLAKYLIGDPQLLTDLLYKEDSNIEIVVKLEEEVQENGS